MVTPVQKHFRTEMQELNRSGYEFDANSIYHSGKNKGIRDHGGLIVLPESSSFC